MTVRINKQKINLREKLTEFEDKVNFEEVVRGLGEYDGNVGIGVTSPSKQLHIEDTNANSPGLKISASDLGYEHEIRANGDGLLLSADNANYGGSGPDIRFNVSGSEHMRIKKGGNVGIGTTNPDAKLSIGGESAPAIKFISTHSDLADGNITINEAGSVSINADASNNSTQYETNFRVTVDGDEHVRIKANGNVGIGTTNPGYPLTVHQDITGNIISDFVHETNNAPNGIRIRFSAASPDNKTNYFLKCQAAETPNERMVVWSNGDIETNLGNSIGTLSDIRTKDSVVDATPKLSDVMKLRVVNFTRKNDPDKTKLIGFVAQEVEEVFPRFVASGDNREYDEDGNVVSGFEDVKSVKFDSGFAILTKAIQEQQQIIEDLKSRIETLESK